MISPSSGAEFALGAKKIEQLSLLLIEPDHDLGWPWRHRPRQNVLVSHPALPLLL